MYEVLAYLIESFSELDACPSQEILSRRLNAVGFDSEEVEHALIWLSELKTQRKQTKIISEHSTALRILNAEEAQHIPIECQEFLYFLERQHGIDAQARELILDRLMAIDSDELDVSTMRIIVITVLWSLAAKTDLLIVDLLVESDFNEEWMH